MKTAYLTSLTTAFNPFSQTAKVPRLFLNLLPPAAHRSIQIKNTQLPRTSTQPAFLELGFKDGKKLKYEWSEEDFKKADGPEAKKKKVAKLQDVVEEVDRHARITGRKEDLNG
jgi:large subunit ribosomal protein L53